MPAPIGNKAYNNWFTRTITGDERGLGSKYERALPKALGIEPKDKAEISAKPLKTYDNWFTRKVTGNERGMFSNLDGALWNYLGLSK